MPRGCEYKTETDTGFQTSGRRRDVIRDQCGDAMEGAVGGADTAVLKLVPSAMSCGPRPWSARAVSRLTTCPWETAGFIQS